MYLYHNLDARKATTPTNQMHNQPQQSNHPHVHGHAHTQQFNLPLQNITK